MNPSQVLFVVNLLSGTYKNKNNLIQLIKKKYPSADIICIEKKEDFEKCLEISKNEQYQYLIVGGGDGTIRSFLSTAVEYKKILGILPIGSGNGLARSLKLPLSPIHALERIAWNRTKPIDIGKLTIEDTSSMSFYFSCAVGLGIDASIAQKFESQKIRGLMGYLWASISQSFDYKSPSTFIQIDDEVKLSLQKYLLLSIMNIPQYGNNFYLCPSAKLDDGLLNIVLLKEISYMMYPLILWNILFRKEKPPMEYYTSKEVKIKINSSNGYYCHMDGEPYYIQGEHQLCIMNMPAAISVLY